MIRREENPELQFEVNQLNSLNAPAFARLTYSRMQRYLLALSPTLQAFGAWREGRPVGLLLLETVREGSNAQIISLCVAEPWRRNHVAGSLLQLAETALIKLGTRSLRITFHSAVNSSPALPALLAQQGWNTPRRKHWICQGTIERFRAAPWLKQDPLGRLGADFHVLPWIDLSSAQRLELKNAVGDWIPAGLSPFSYVGLDPSCSLALLHRGRPVGWVLAQQQGSDTLVYASSFIRPDLRGRGHLIAAYAEACRRQGALTQRRHGVWIVPMAYQPMATFVDRRMRPYLDTVEEFLTTEKMLGGTFPDEAWNLAHMEEEVLSCS